VSRSRSLAKGAIAGLIGGIVATAAKTAAERIYPPRAHGKAEHPALLKRRIAGRQLTIRQRDVAQKTIHWGLGAATGAAYGALAEFYPAATAKQGASFGMAFAAATQDGALPALGLATAPADKTTREKSSELVSYVVYGVVTETVRSIVRRMID
jgi:putative membrane protein